VRPISEKLVTERSAVLWGNGAGKTGLRRAGRRCGRCLRRSGGPGHRGGETVLPGPTPDPARCLPLGHLVAGLLQQHARVEARSKGNFPCFQPRASSCREGCRERRLWALPRPSRPAGRSSFPIGRPGRPPMQGANRVAPGRPRGVRGTPLPFLPACGDLQPRTMSWPVTRTSVIPIDRSGAAPGGRGRQRAVPRKHRRPQENCGRQLAKRNCGVR